MVMLEKLGMETANKQAGFDLEKGQEGWKMGKELYNAPAFNPEQNIGEVTTAIQPQMRSMQADFAKRGFSGSGGEFAGLGGLQSGALSSYLLNARERADDNLNRRRLSILGMS